MLDKTFSLRVFVADLLDKGYDSETVIPTLVRQADSNLSLRDALLTIGAKQAVRTYFADARSEAYPIRGARAEIVREEKRETKTGKATITKAERDERQAAKENRRTMLDTYTLWGHTPLRDATKADIRASIANRKTQVAGGLKAIKFEQAVLDQLPENKTCGQAFSATKIDKLWMQHYGR
jgi:hypothetical protein